MVIVTGMQIKEVSVDQNSNSLLTLSLTQSPPQSLSVSSNMAARVVKVCGAGVDGCTLVKAIVFFSVFDSVSIFTAFSSSVAFSLIGELPAVAADCERGAAIGVVVTGFGKLPAEEEEEEEEQVGSG